MRRNSYLSRFWVAVLALAVAGCGSSSSTSNQPKPTGLRKRVLLSNVAVRHGQPSGRAKRHFYHQEPWRDIGHQDGHRPAASRLSLDSTVSEITIIDNATEAVTFAAPIGDLPFDIAITPDGKNAWTAQRGFGFVQSVDTSNGVARPVIRIPNARRLAMSPKGTKLLVFSDPQAQVPPNTHTFFIVDTATGTFQTITDAAHLDQPFTAVFGASDTQAFILNCGAECGGTAASVVSVDFSNAAPVFSAADSGSAAPPSG